MLKEILRKFLSRRMFNNFYHLPKAVLANIRYGFPGRGMTVIGVTGTDGKTTTVNMIYQILKLAGKKVSMISTINAVTSGKIYDTGFHVTSPDPNTLQKFTKMAKTCGSEYLVLEVTSHALDQYRFWGIKFDVGVITNITHEHLDYHKTFENYLQTKFRLVRDVKFAIINQKLYQYVGRSSKLLAKEWLTFGLSKSDFNQRRIKLKLKIPGDYNIENALASFATACVLGIDQNIARKALENFTGVAGRMQQVPNSRGIKIFIDFAHTPNGLEQALKTLRGQTKGRLIAVFGSAGKRDVAKRNLMGEIAGRLADIAIVTAEDPRGEIDTINKQITDGTKKVGGIEGVNYYVISDRSKAIDFAINHMAKKGDTAGIFGKGHESSMNLDGQKEIPWSDVMAVKKALRVY